ncbi:MAG: transporter [Porphyromonadaceae bacterium]|nr:MAG: transporter [Porphyromonadaceae bacterium]
MKALVIVIFFLTTGYSSLLAQGSVDRIVAEIEKNNTGLSALRKKAEAQKLGNKTGIYLKNPEIGFNYLWGNPTMIGNRVDLSFEQTFDFPTAYRYKSQIADGRDQQVDIDYQQQRLGLITQVRMLCIDLAHTYALENEFARRLEHAQSIVKSYQAKFDQGDAGILELNKARLNFLGIRKEAEANGIEYQSLLAELATLNGGIPIAWSESIYPSREIPADFEQWYQQAEKSNPMLTWLRKELEISQQQEKLQFALGLPKFSTGYLNEKIVGEHFQGVTLGMSIPLWENKNAVKQAKAQFLAVQDVERDRKLMFYNQLKMLHAKAVRLQQSTGDYRLALQTVDNGSFLGKALEAGEISLIDYILELSLYYESQTRLLAAERDLNRVISELYQFLE